MEIFLGFWNYLTTEQPPAFTLWVALVLGLMRIGQIINDSFEKKKSEQKSIDDLFWYREIVIPYCLFPIKEFIEEQSNDLLLLTDSSPASDYEKYLNNFQYKQGIVNRRIVVTGAVNQKMSPFVNEKLEKLEDDIAIYCSKKVIKYTNGKTLDRSDVDARFHETFRDVVKEFRENHHSLFSG